LPDRSRHARLSARAGASAFLRHWLGRPRPGPGPGPGRGPQPPVYLVRHRHR